MGRLTDRSIRNLKPADRDRWVGDGNGLWLRVRTTGTKVFVLRTKRGGRARVITLGEFPGVTLGAARLEAAKLGADRAGHLLRGESEPLTVTELAKEYFDRRIAGRYRRTKSARTYRDRLVKDLGWRRARDVRAQDIAKSAAAYANSAPVAANRYLSFCKLVFRHGVQTGVLEASPAVDLTAAVAGGEETPRERVLSDAELRKLWHAQGTHVRLLRYLMLTGARIGEAQRAQWAHIDLARRRWTIPAANAKNRHETWVHLTDAALSALPLPGDAHALVLRSASETAVQAWMRRWCNRESINPAITPHDLRRSYVTRMADLGVPPHVIKKLINHRIDDGALAVYLRADFAAERIEATERWSAELLRIVSAGAA